MVCSIGTGKMTALARLSAGSILQKVTEELGQQKVAVQHIQRELRGAVEDNLLDEEDMNLFGLRPMADPLYLVCCNSCKKPIMICQYAAHAELCKSFSVETGDVPELDDFVGIKKPPRKERKKSINVRTNQISSQREKRKYISVNSGNIGGSESYLGEPIQIMQLSEVKGNSHVNGSSLVNGSRVRPSSMNFSDKGALGSSKPFKGTTAEGPSDSGTMNLHVTTAEVVPYVPTPLATKIYYSQSSHHLQRAIRHMYYEEPLDCGCDSSHLKSQVNRAPDQASSPCQFYHESILNQQRDDHLLHPPQTPDQTLLQSSDLCAGRSGGVIQSAGASSQLHVNNTIGSHFVPNSCSFASKPGNHLGTVQ